ncbi:hypothetical protein MTX25_34720 [Bradyrhizobium sp. ISRA432]|nr:MULTISPECIES: hypothetical protein [unclassified Bradyrhizobium]WGR82565.1 hypothetical protein MTX21_20135 [Bradyrhizobium sp. ISRA430]WGR85752.1 hypothetical protein MTX25_34720 [Bradyrhizobium sp. ISRA432]
MAVVPLQANPKPLRASAAIAAAAIVLGVAHFWISPSSPIAIFAIDGDTVRHQGRIYRLVGFDTATDTDVRTSGTALNLRQITRH